MGAPSRRRSRRLREGGREGPAREREREREREGRAEPLSSSLGGWGGGHPPGRGGEGEKVGGQILVKYWSNSQMLVKHWSNTPLALPLHGEGEGERGREGEGGSRACERACASVLALSGPGRTEVLRRVTMAGPALVVAAASKRRTARRGRRAAGGFCAAAPAAARAGRLVRTELGRGDQARRVPHPFARVHNMGLKPVCACRRARGRYGARAARRSEERGGAGRQERGAAGARRPQRSGASLGRAAGQREEPPRHCQRNRRRQPRRWLRCSHATIAAAAGKGI